MSIYIEEFLLQNLAINFCLIRMVYLTLKPKSSFFRQALSSIVGASASVISAIFISNSMLMNLLKISSAILMIALAFKQSKKQFIASFILLFLYTYALGGAITALSSNIQTTTFGFISYTKVNLSIITAIIIIITYIFELILRSIKLRLKTNNYIYQITLTHNNRSVKINAYLDTGNLLNIEGKPVTIIDINTYLALTHKTLIDFYLSESKTINTSTVTGNNYLKIFTIDKLTLTIKNKVLTFNNQYIAVNSANNFNDQNYQALLSPMFL